MSGAQPRLITLALSPYNDFARWSLDRSRIPYEEERKALIVHTLASRRAGGKGTTPVLVTDEETLGESAEIVRVGRPPLPHPGHTLSRG